MSFPTSEDGQIASYGKVIHPFNFVIEKSGFSWGATYVYITPEIYLTYGGSDEVDLELFNIKLEWGSSSTDYIQRDIFGQKTTMSDETFVAQWIPNPSYFSSDWADRIGRANLYNYTKELLFTKDISKTEGYSNSISVGTNSVTDSSAYVQSDTINDVTAYYNDDYSKIVFYSIGPMYAPENSSWLFAPRYDLPPVTQNNSTVYPWGLPSFTSMKFDNFNTSYVKNMSYMFRGSGKESWGWGWFLRLVDKTYSQMTSLDLSGFLTSNVTNASGMFYGQDKLTYLYCNKNFSSCTTMSSMFYNCSSLTSLSLSSFNTSAVTSMSSMFYGCSGLTSLSLSSFNTSAVTTMYSMFNNCSSLVSLNLSSFDTSAVTDMDSMFRYCSAITSLNLSNFNTSSVTDMRNMFHGCSGLTSLNLSNFNTSKVTYMRYMFQQCSSITNLDLSNFDTSAVTTMKGMFYNCTALGSINLSSFNVSKVTNIECMFSRCSSLTALDLGGFDLTACTVTTNFLSGCKALAGITLPYNLQSSYTITLPLSTYYNGSAGPYSTVGSATSETTVACSTASSKVTLTTTEASAPSTDGGGGAEPSADSGGCLAYNTPILTSDGWKMVQDLTYADRLVVFNHDTGEVSTSYITWMLKELQVSPVIEVTFSDGEKIRFVYDHAVFSLDYREYVSILDTKKFGVGSRVLKLVKGNCGDSLCSGCAICSQSQNGCTWGEVIVTNIEYINETVPTYAVITSGMWNCFAGNILTTVPNTLLFQNMYGFKEDLTYASDIRRQYLEGVFEGPLYTEQELRNLGVVDRDMVGFRGEEWKMLIESGQMTEDELVHEIFEKFVNNPYVRKLPPVDEDGDFVFMVTNSLDVSSPDFNPQDMWQKEYSQYILPNLEQEGFVGWRCSVDGKIYSAGDIYIVRTGTHFEAVFVDE